MNTRRRWYAAAIPIVVWVQVLNDDEGHSAPLWHVCQKHLQRQAAG